MIAVNSPNQPKNPSRDRVVGSGGSAADRDGQRRDVRHVGDLAWDAHRRRRGSAGGVRHRWPSTGPEGRRRFPMWSRLRCGPGSSRSAGGSAWRVAAGTGPRAAAGGNRSTTVSVTLDSSGGGRGGGRTAGRVATGEVSAGSGGSGTPGLGAAATAVAGLARQWQWYGRPLDGGNRNRRSGNRRHREGAGGRGRSGGRASGARPA